MRLDATAMTTDSFRELLEAGLSELLSRFDMTYAGGHDDATLLRRQFLGQRLFLEALVDRRDGRLSLTVGRPVGDRIPPTPFIITATGTRSTSVSAAAIQLTLTGDRRDADAMEVLIDESPSSLAVAIGRQSAVLAAHIDELLDGATLLMGFAKLAPQVARHSDGYVVQIGDRYHVEYVDGDAVAHVPADLEGPVVLLRAQAVVWVRPNERPATADEGRTIIARIVEGLGVLGESCKILDE
jgi:hypothetical protein